MTTHTGHCRAFTLIRCLRNVQDKQQPKKVNPYCVIHDPLERTVVYKYCAIRVYSCPVVATVYFLPFITIKLLHHHIYICIIRISFLFLV